MSDDLAISGLSKRFGTIRVLAGLDLTAPAGALTALIGRSGCGKTTVLRLVAGFDRPDAGTVAVGGRDLGPLPAHQRRIGYVTQHGDLFPHLTVAGNITFGLPWRRRDRRTVDDLLDLVGLDRAHARRFPHQLSGGEQQRVALARALAPAPDLVLLDEPFSALDADLRAETRRAVTSALRETGTTTVLVTHDQAEALSLADRVALLRDGRVVQAGTPHELYRQPADRWVAAFVGELSSVPALLSGDHADSLLGRVALPRPRHGAGTVVVRPEQITLDGTVGAVVLAVDFHGHDGLVRLRVDPTDGPPFEVMARAAGHLLPVPGERTGLRLSGTALDATADDSAEVPLTGDQLAPSIRSVRPVRDP
ncbi:ABC transporter ATP-binding protein [Virgisporangium aurantiacum]|uniref:ABC-type quaternary amine transporter n=1 Tax=Virgisporangium aurantiacum TaxID=175570 RepID=A0A8J3Z0G0_9ACTN|nr:ABC transporter ATP-binding protein [Virgisporangium aurantiacum]GIJ54167.1 iron ABC transporter ATP-binding protein [Virgisporangium aurantiacum]